MNAALESLKSLREKTGAGMMDCKRALQESGGDISAAESLIESWGLKQAQKRAERETKEGRIGLAQDSAKASMAWLACETDFVSRSEPFERAASAIARASLERDAQSSDPMIVEIVDDLRLRLKENIVLKGIASISAQEGELIDCYLHSGGGAAAAVRIRAEPAAAAADPVVRGIAHDLCLQVTAGRPEYIEAADIPEERLVLLEAEFRAEVEADPKLAEKPDKLKESIMAGRLKKYRQTSCLMEQRFIKDEARTVREHVETQAQDLGVALKVLGFLRMSIDEG